MVAASGSLRRLQGVSSEIAGLLTNDVRRHSMGKRAYASSRAMTWAQTAKRYLMVFEAEHQNARPGMPLPRMRSPPGREGHVIPEIRIGHFLSLCDSTGMLQHSVHSVPDRPHGYCVDDNARALLFSTLLTSSGEARLPARSRRALPHSSSTPGIRTRADFEIS